MSGKLYIVPTPVGNMSDMTPRAVEVLKGCSRIFAEDTRTSGVLLKHFGIDTPCSSHHKFNEHATVSPIIEMLAAGETIALISDAGTPGISDPGFLLTRECRREGIEVETLPGPTAFVPALVNSGLPTDRFTFEGFLPPKKGRRTRLESIASNNCTSIIYESPLRLVKTLGELISVCGPDRPASVSREISKLHDTTHRGTLKELEEYFKENIPRGEIVIVLGADEDNSPKIHKNKYKE
ncbi:16S rRNA (cytidine(1402)-2'-O)-methyltransferase [uncultured Duncaniella sp.]|uniref:16S rRNA (cytidine(1402)-2'-O)-methyltransferase n=1 Tax=uncultured Duncaniella sp. TaxID=2768039 RepID=UPI0026761D39|nr:16S rRNA (cytidine(1402)-2'-O)-methyltransferase [uncultured Duncaniella sp.]MCI9172296.1 16S rRNA (cytidine(1402)-2'-O)-methyltransferase [Muribaculaceae bacterium]